MTDKEIQKKEIEMNYSLLARKNSNMLKCELKKIKKSWTSSNKNGMKSNKILPRHEVR